MPEFIDGFTGINEKTNTAGREETRGREKEEKNMVKVLDVEGMMCAHCQAHVQKALEEISGVTEVTVDLEQKTATVAMESEIADEKLSQAVTEAGYQVKSCRIA